MMHWLPHFLLYAAIGANIGGTVYTAVMWKRRSKTYEKAMMDNIKTLSDSISELLPAVAFCALMRDSPDVPPQIRQMAATAIPKSVGIITSTESGKVH